MNRKALDRARARSLARVSGNGASRSTVGTNLTARVETVIPIVHVHNRRAPKMTAAQRDSTGKRSAWNASPDFFTDPAWAYTLSNRPDPGMRAR